MSSRPRLDPKVIVVIVVVAVAAAATGVVAYWYVSQEPFATPALLTMVDHDDTQNGYGEYTFTGRVVNSGDKASNPVTITISFEDNNKNIFYTTTTSTEPSIIQPKSEASFSKVVTDGETGGKLLSEPWGYYVYVS